MNDVFLFFFCSCSHVKNNFLLNGVGEACVKWGLTGSEWEEQWNLPLLRLSLRA